MMVFVMKVAAARSALVPRLQSKWALACLLLVVGLVSFSISPVIGYGINEPIPTIPPDGFTTVVQRPLSVTITQNGETASSRNAVIVSKCEWRVPLLWIEEQGTLVKQGDLIAELDATELEEKRREREVRLIKARSDLALAEAEYQMQDLTNQSTLAAARLQALLSELQLEGYQTAEFPQQKHALESEVVLAEQDLSYAREQLAFVSSMVRLGYRSASEREEQRLEVVQAEQDLAVAKNKLEVLTNFTKGRQIREFAALAEEGERNLLRTQSTGRASLLSCKVNLQAERRSVHHHEQYLERIKRSIEACKIHAPQDGQVLIAEQSRRTDRPFEAGDEVRYLRELIKLPNRNHMQVDLRVHESQFHRVVGGSGLPAKIRVDSMPDKPLRGKVTRISTVPMRGRWPNVDRREYAVTVQILEEPDVVQSLPPGTSATVEILSAYRPDAIQAPLHSVIDVMGKQMAFVRQGDDILAREVEIGVASHEAVEVLSGLQPGDEIVAKPRVTCAALINDLESRILAERSRQIGSTRS